MYSLFNFFLIPPLPPSLHELFSTQLRTVTTFSTCLSQLNSLLPLAATSIQRKFDNVKTHIYLKHMQLWQEKTGIKVKMLYERTLDMPIIPREFDL